jgi:hypothetical protein
MSGKLFQSEGFIKDGFVRKDQCESIYPLQMRKLNPDEDHKCYICNKPAIHEATPQHKEGFEIYKIYLCSRHEKVNMGCTNKKVQLIFAPCLFMKRKSQCESYVKFLE